MKRLLIVLGVAMSLACVSDALANNAGGKGKAKGKTKRVETTTTNTSVPEPASILAGLAALGGAAWAMRRRLS
jgi:hypothetical protein